MPSFRLTICALAKLTAVRMTIQRQARCTDSTAGAEKLVWGSDMPNAERFCTYQQSLDHVRRHCGFLSAAEKDRILGDNVAALFGLA